MTDAPMLEPLEEATTDTSAVSPFAELTIAATAAGAAVIHFAMFPQHYQESVVLGMGFALAGWAQLAVSVAIMARPSKRVLQAGLIVSLAIMAGWAVSRLVGLPLSGDAGAVEDVSQIDLLSTIFEGVTAMVCAAALVRGPVTRTSGNAIPAGALALPVIAVALLTTSVLASPEAEHHVHGEGAGGEASAEHTAGEHDMAGMATDEHAAGEHDMAAMDDPAATDVAAGAEHDMADMAMAEPVPYDPTKPLDFSGVPGVTPEEQAEAENIVAVTLAGLPQWSDPAVAEAAGFRSIGDGGTGIEHFVNRQNMQDELTFDPDVPESLVYDTSTGERRLVAAMYMLKEGTPLDEVPTTGGALIQWHIHNNLCYNAEGQVRGLTDGNGNCPTGLIKPPETPMVHVWLEPHPCGPFAALEGIGAGAIAEGEERLCDTAHGSH